MKVSFRKCGLTSKIGTGHSSICGSQVGDLYPVPGLARDGFGRRSSALQRLQLLPITDHG